MVSWYTYLFFLYVLCYVVACGNTANIVSPPRRKGEGGDHHWEEEASFQNLRNDGWKKERKEQTLPFQDKCTLCQQIGMPHPSLPPPPPPPLCHPTMPGIQLLSSSPLSPPSFTSSLLPSDFLNASSLPFFCPTNGPEDVLLQSRPNLKCYSVGVMTNS